MPSVNSVVHPSYTKYEADFKKWRLTMEGGTAYKDEYLTARPKETDFESRRDISYVPAFAKEAVLEMSRAIHQRLPRVSRSGGTGTYLEACKGRRGGVDRRGSTMNSFISRKLVDELCFMGLTGVYVDNIIPTGVTKADIRDTDHPYVYAYAREDIRDWAYDFATPNKLKYVVLREEVTQFDPISGLRDKTVKRFRYAYLNQAGGVTVEFYDESGAALDQMFQPSPSPFQWNLELTRIPFTVIDLGLSLVADVADYQISHMTLASLDMNFAVKSNIPFYTEQRAPFGNDLYAQHYSGLPKDEDGVEVDPQDLTEDAREKYLVDRAQVAIGSTMGRVYSSGMDRPGFIHPSSEPLQASMQKQEVIKSEIRELVALSLKQAGLRFQSEGSKKLDDRPLEAGLSYIGLILEAAEADINAVWAEYETATPCVVKYPETYNLLTETERREAIKQDKALMSVVPSATFRLEMQKAIISTKFAHVLDPLIVAQMEQEVMGMSAPTADPEEIRSDIEAGILSAALGSLIRGYPEGEADRAQEEKAIRLNIATRLQAQAHDNPDEQTPQQAAEAQKAEKSVVNNPDVNLSDMTRGKGKEE